MNETLSHKLYITFADRIQLLSCIIMYYNHRLVCLCQYNTDDSVSVSMRLTRHFIIKKYVYCDLKLKNINYSKQN